MNSSDAMNIYERATKAELTRDLDTAFRLYIDAGTAFINLSHAPGIHPHAYEEARQCAARAVERAERIKAVKADLTPVWRDPFALEEQQRVLQKGSTINGVAAPLWTSPSSSLVAVGTTGTLFRDPDGLLELSVEQKEAGVVWRRPSEVWASAKNFSSDLRPEDISQRVVADCSLCASIVVCLLHCQSHNSQEALPSLYPHGFDGKPQLSSTGGYELKIFFNGAYRRVVIDDFLPFRPNGSRMCMTSRGRRDIWPSLVEKAYLKLMGGYDFPGSNSSVDIHALVEWIPDYIEVKSPTFQREQTWSRLSRGFNDGQCILTVGTDDRPIVYRGRMKLLPSHCYAVIDANETEDGSRWLTILDSWLPAHDSTEVGALLDDLSLDNEGKDRRSIDIPWDDICTIFGSVCVSWNPVIFKNRLVYHGVWRAAHLSPAERDESAHLSLRLRLESEDAQRPLGEVWILLTRHRIDTRRSSEFISLHAEYDDAHPVDSRDLIGTAKTQGVYTNNPHVLVRVTVPPSDVSGMISLNISYDGSFDDIGFTVTAYSEFGMRWDGPLRVLPFVLRVSGALTTKTSGGNYTLLTYMINPQYRLRVPGTAQDGPSAKTRVEISLHAPRDVPINAIITWGRGERVFDLVQSDIIATSGAYTYGFARLCADLPQGDVTLAISAFSPTHLGDFSVMVCSSRRVEVEPIPQEGAGMFSKVIRGDWTNDARLRYSLELPTPTDVKIRLQPHAPAFVRVELFLATGGTPVSSSGAFTDARSGAATAQVALRTGHYIVELTVDGISSAKGLFSLTVYSLCAGISLARLR